jgi:hypothetical protein
LAQEIEISADKLQAFASGALGRGVASIEPMGGGRNSRVYRVRCTDDSLYALKAYFRHPSDIRDRLKTEYNALQFLWEHGIDNVPRPLAVDREAALALYTYAMGDRPTPGEQSDGDIAQAADFLGRLKALADALENDELPSAAEACFSGGDLLANLLCRLDRLAEQQHRPTASPLLKPFLRDEMMPIFEKIIAWSRLQRPFEEVLPRSSRTLSPSDFGFHNAVRQRDGRWIFLDFEYFGWDDPAKTISDFLLHPAMILSEEKKKLFTGQIMRHFAQDRSLVERVKCYYPLFGLKWCMILLNEFLPEHFLRRRFAAGSDKDLQAAQAEQLTKTRRMMKQMDRQYEHFPYFD